MQSHQPFCIKWLWKVSDIVKRHTIANNPVNHAIYQSHIPMIQAAQWLEINAFIYQDRKGNCPKMSFGAMLCKNWRYSTLGCHDCTLTIMACNVQLLLWSSGQFLPHTLALSCILAYCHAPKQCVIASFAIINVFCPMRYIEWPSYQYGNRCTIMCLPKCATIA
jgi:hypothetical protein